MTSLIETIRRFDSAGHFLSVACRNGKPVGLCTRLADPTPPNDPDMMAMLQCPEQKRQIIQTLIEIGRID